MNKVFLIGRLTGNPEIRYTGNNVPVANFTIAIDRNFTNQEGEKEVDFIPIVVWKKQAENAKNYLFKGSKVAVDGRIQVRSYEDTTGNKRYVTEVIAENLQFLDSKKESQPTQAQTTTSTTQSKEDPFAEMGKQVSEEEYPF